MMWTLKTKYLRNFIIQVNIDHLSKKFLQHLFVRFFEEVSFFQGICSRLTQFSGNEKIQLTF